MPMEHSAHAYLPDLGVLGVLGRELFRLLPPNFEAHIRRNLILLMTPEQAGGIRNGLLITRVNAFTLDCHSVAFGGPAPQKEGDRIVVLEGSDGIRFHFRKRLLAPYELASELIGMVMTK